MNEKAKSKCLKDFILGVCVFISSITTAWMNLGLRITDLSLAWLTSSDLLSNYLQSSGIHDSGSRWQYPRINLTTQSDVGVNLSPQFDWLHVLQLRALNTITKNPITAVNIWLLLSFGFTSLLFFVLLRILKIGRLTAVLMSLTFGLLPFHFIRMQHAIVVQYSWAVCLVLILILVSSPEVFKISKRRLQGICVFSALCISGSGAYAVLYSLFFISIMCVISVPTFIRKKEFFSKAKLSLIGPMVLITCAVVQVLLFRAQKLSVNQQLLFPLRPAEDNRIYALRLFELLFPSESSPWYRYGFGWLRDKILVQGVNFCPAGTFSDYANRYVCNSNVEGASYGSLLSTLAVICVLSFGLKHLLSPRGEISRLFKICFGLLVMIILTTTVGGLGSILGGVIPAARKTGILVPLLGVIFLLIFALIIENVANKVRVISKAILLTLVLFVLISDNFLTKYTFVTETRSEQEILKSYVSKIDQQTSKNCRILRAPLDLPRYEPTRVSPSEYLSALYSVSNSWIFVDPDVTSIEFTGVADAYWWIVGMARSKGYCALELGNRNFSVDNALNFAEVADFLEDVLKLTTITKSSDSNFRLYSLKSGVEKNEPLVNILDGGYVREPVGLEGAWRWARNSLRYRVFSPISQCAHLKSRVQSIGGTRNVYFSLNGINFSETVTETDVSEFVLLKTGLNILKIETSGAEQILANGQLGSSYVFDPIVITAPQRLCKTP
jgi:hypothetical protein